MKSFIIWFLGILLLGSLTTCRKEPELRSIKTYELIETAVYYEELDSIITYKPNNESEIIRMILFRGYFPEEADWWRFYRGDELLTECTQTGTFTHDASDYCLNGMYCYQLGCDFYLCEEYTSDGIYAFPQLPFLDDEFGGYCTRVSMFKLYSSQFE
ncbi:MAG: hypothetical protein ACKVOK_04310 [Flavobacteriales bacterium]